MNTYWTCPLLLFALVLSFGGKTQECPGTLRGNLVAGGDFGSGTLNVLPNDPMLAPGYGYQNNPPPEDGFYTIASTTDFGDPLFCWVASGDNSPDPNGYMMVVNASFEPGIFFEQEVAVCNGITYEFSVDLLNLMRIDCPDAIRPEVDFLVDGQVVHESGELPQDENWHTYRTQVAVALGTASITIALRNKAPGGFGNDLAIDNISLRHCAPNIDLPPITQACADGVLLSAADAMLSYPEPSYQWQRSFDGGTSWQDIPGAQAVEHFVANPIAGLQYRLLVANGPALLQAENCRAVSTPTTLQLQTPLTIFITPVICAGDTLELGDQLLTQPGNYSIPLPGQSGCDSLLEVFLFAHPSYNQLFFQSLCAGESFLGQTFVRDTTFSLAYQTAQGCDSIVTYEIDVFAPAGLSISGDTLICEGATTVWQAPPGYSSYHWSTGASGPSISLNTAGTYQLSIQNSQGCEYILSQTLSLSAPFAEVDSEDLSCPGAVDGRVEVLFADGGLPPYEYRLAGEWGSGRRFEGLPPGLYRVQIRDALGCESEQWIQIDEPPGFGLRLDGLPEGAVAVGERLPLSARGGPATAAYQWAGEGRADCPDCPATEWLVLGPRLSLSVIDLNGCEQRLDTVLVLRDRYRVYWPNAFSPNGDGQNDSFAPGLGSDVEAVLLFGIYDRWGGKMYEATERSPMDTGWAWDGNWRGQPLSSGTYLYQAEILFQDGQRRAFAGEVLLLR
jgi:gliding motility-associated-like protein